MSRLPATLAAAIVAVLAPAAAAAQSDAALVSVSVAAVVDEDVTVVNTAGLDFGYQPSGSLVKSSDVPTAASWNVTFNTAGDYSFVFSLPGLLYNPQGQSVPIFYGNTSGSILGTQFSFDPAAGFAVQPAPVGSILDILLGADIFGDDTGDVSVDLADAVPTTTYSGTVTLTVYGPL